MSNTANIQSIIPPRNTLTNIPFDTEPNTLSGIPPATPITPPPNYDDVMTGKDKPPSYESQATAPPIVEQPTTLNSNLNNIETGGIRNSPHYASGRRHDTPDTLDIGCEPYYDPDTNNCLVCLICNIFCRPITCCVQCCEECCEECNSAPSPDHARRRYLNDDTMLYSDYNNHNNEYTPTSCFGGEYEGGADYGENGNCDTGGDNSGNCDTGGDNSGNCVTGGDNSGNCDTGGGCSDTGGGDCGGGGDSGGGCCDD